MSKTNKPLSLGLRIAIQWIRAMKEVAMVVAMSLRGLAEVMREFNLSTDPAVETVKTEMLMAYEAVAAAKKEVDDAALERPTSKAEKKAEKAKKKAEKKAAKLKAKEEATREALASREMQEAEMESLRRNLEWTRDELRLMREAQAAGSAAPSKPDEAKRRHDY